MTKAEIQLVRSLADKRARTETGLFVAEGHKLVAELRASGLRVRKVYEGREAERVSLLKTPSDMLALIEIPSYALPADAAARGLVLALDEVQNPGNLGTIIRLADWFGISDIVCSPGTADCYNPKVVQATMGAIARVRVHYTDLGEWLAGVDTPVYGTFLDGENIHTATLSQHGVIVMGNEGQGITPAVERRISRRLFIPPYPANHAGSESLNVAVATGIVCSEFRRRENSNG